VADRFAVAEGTALADQGACFLVNRAALAAVGTGGVGGEGLGLLLQEASERPLGQSPGGGRGDLFEGGQVGVEAGAGIPEGPARHNFAPLGRQVTDILEFLGSQLRSGHRLSCLEVAPSDVEGLFFPFYRKVVRPAKPVLASLAAADGN
jgi:hypothetical protein